MPFSKRNHIQRIIGAAIAKDKCSTLAVNVARGNRKASGRRDLAR